MARASPCARRLVATTPKKSARTLDEEGDKITRLGKWKRGRSQEEETFTLDELEEPQGRRAAAKTARAGAEMALSRGSCSRCLQENILGWPREGEGGAALFECCACHDANDDDE